MSRFVTPELTALCVLTNEIKSVLDWVFSTLLHHRQGANHQSNFRCCLHVLKPEWLLSALLSVPFVSYNLDNQLLFEEYNASEVEVTNNSSELEILQYSVVYVAWFKIRALCT